LTASTTSVIKDIVDALYKALYKCTID